MKAKKLIYPIIAGVICLILIVALVIGNVACYLNANIITSFLCGYGFDEDGTATVAARESGNALAEDVEEEWAVLLKNENDALPLKTDKVNVFGWTGSDNGFIPQGTGSGTGSRNDYVTFLGGLTQAGIEYNTELADAYAQLPFRRIEGGSFVIEATTEELYDRYYGVTEAAEDFYSDALIHNAVEYSDTAIVVLGRLMGEGNDYSKKQYISTGEDNEDRKLLSISEREEYLLDVVTENFETVIVITNTTNPMEMGFIEDPAIDAAMHIGTPGTRGAIGVANLLKGSVTVTGENGETVTEEISPSGHLADTMAYDLSTAASYATSGREGVGSYLDINTDTTVAYRQNKYSEYKEDIYVGYKWYETADAEGFWDSDYAKNRWGIQNGYEDVVQFPFGYGLSYTQFDWMVTDSNISDGTVLSADGTIEIEVTVTNTGDRAGKEVVQLYYTPCYEEGGIEKSAVNLGAYAKTVVSLQPGENTTLKLEMNVSDMKSYDCYDRNNDGHMGYELEEGEYVLSLRTDSHTLKETMDGVNTFTVTVAEDIHYETDDATGATVQNQFTTYTNSASGASSTINEPFTNKPHSIDGADNDGEKIVYMTRADFTGTFPEERGEHKNAGSLIDDMHGIPSDESLTEEGAVAPAWESKDTTWTIQDAFGAPYDDPIWDEMVSQLSLERAALLIARGGFGTIELPEIGKPATHDTDGPSGFNTNVTGGNNLKAVNYPSSTVLAQTWNYYMAYQVGRAIGIEGNALGIDGWYGPGANLHRSPLGGRNFEYYSEDPLLAGITCAYHILGAKEQGVVAYIKHIGPNESDTGRNGAYKWLTEQSLRENYLKPFEYAVKIGGSNGLMASVDRVGGARGSGSYAMLTAVVRNEWGFRGTVITDYYQSGIVNDIDEGVSCGNTQVLHPDLSASLFDDLDSPTAQKYIHKSAKDILYSYAETKYYQMTATGLEIDQVIGQTAEVFAWWIPLLVVIDVVSVGLMALWMFFAIRSAVKEKKKESAK